MEFEFSIGGVFEYKVMLLIDSQILPAMMNVPAIGKLYERGFSQ